MWCPRCGGEIADSDRFCSACGLDLATYGQLWQGTGPQTAQQGPHAYQGPQAYQGPEAYQTPQYRPAAWQGTVPHVPNYLGWAIAVLVLCFWPTGIPAVVYASQVNNKLVRGDIAGAQDSSHKAKMWCWISFGIAIVIFVLLIVAFGLGAIESTDLRTGIDHPNLLCGPFAIDLGT